MSALQVSDTVQVVMIPTMDIDPNAYNPNSMDSKMFNRLVEDMNTLGFVQPVLVVEKEDGRYMVIDGEHRFEAAKLSDMSEIPCVVVRGEFAEDQDQQKFQTMRMNMIRGNLDKRKFQDMVTDLLERHGLEDIAESMAYDDVDALRSMMDSARASLPTPEMRREFDQAREEIKTVDDLSHVLNRLFTRFGSTLPCHFMIMDFGGKEHLWVRFPGKGDYEQVQQLAKACQEKGVTFDSLILSMLRNAGGEYLDAHAEDLTPADEE